MRLSVFPALFALLSTVAPGFADVKLDCRAAQRCNTTIGGCMIPEDMFWIQVTLSDDFRAGKIVSDGNSVRLRGSGYMAQVTGRTWTIAGDNDEVYGLFSYDGEQWYVLTLHAPYEDQVTGITITGFCNREDS